jgi:hypothetical protein
VRGDLKERDHLGDLHICGRIILKRILKNLVVRVAGFISLGIGYSAGLL